MKILEPGKIGTMSLKNRIALGPMGIGGLIDLDGGLTTRAKDFYVARAKGGTGLIITTACLVTTVLEKEFISLIGALDDGKKIGRLNEIAEEVHIYGSKLCVQLSAGLGRVCAVMPGVKVTPVAPSEQPTFWNPAVMCRALTKDEIKLLVKSFGEAASYAKVAGADAVEIHGYGGYLVDQFNSAAWNKRTDEYGGDLTGRLRFSMEIIEEIQKTCGKDFPILYKFTPDHTFEGGRDLAEGLEMAKRLEKAGVAALHVDMGCYDNWSKTIASVYYPPAVQIHLAAAVKKAVKIPVIEHGKLGFPEIAESVLAEGKVDFVALGRPLLTDPDWVNKIEEGKADEIRPCICCYEGCLSRITDGKYVSCAVNPACGKEKEYELIPAREPKSVLVIGGGPGGMEAAITAARRGHKVSLWEKGPKLGGKLIPASRPVFKLDVERYLDYLIDQVNKLDIDLCLMKEATGENILEKHADIVILATGSETIIPNLPGIDADNVLAATDVLVNKKSVGNKVVVVGGGFVGCETAVFLKQQGKDVTIVEMVDHLLPEPMYVINQMTLLKMIADSGIKVFTSTKLTEVKDGGIVVESDGKKEDIACDTVVLALGFKAKNKLAESLTGKVRKLYTVGDAVDSRRVKDAVWEGFHIARVI